MKLFEIKQKLIALDSIAFQLPDGSLIPNHFHVTEVGKGEQAFYRLWGYRPKGGSCQFPAVGGQRLSP